MNNREFNPDTSQIQGCFKGLKIHSRIGSGGQKIVYRAEHPKYGKVALKLVRPSGLKETERILREISAATKLTGPEFPKIHFFGEIKIGSTDTLYVFEELLEGQSLRQLLSATKKISLQRTLKITKELLEALVKVEKANIVHRDIKPENIFITEDNRVVLIDFGIARHLTLPSITHDFALLGPLTPGYAAPEQIRNEKRKISTRTDIFLLGIVVYECLAGCNPFYEGCSDVREALNKNLNYDPRPLSTFGFPQSVSDFVETCLRKHPSRRYSSPREALKIVGNILEEVK